MNEACPQIMTGEKRMFDGEKMRICIISSQILGYGKIGGFGSMTKKLAESLAGRGHTVSVIVPKKRKQKLLVNNGKYDIYGLRFIDIFCFKSLMRRINADIYHSQNPNVFSYLAMKADPGKFHVITCRDPRDINDWLLELRYATWKRRFKTPLVFLFENGPFVSYAIKHADVVGCPANFLKEKLDRMYARSDAFLLPNIEDLPSDIPEKSKTPTICFVGRLDKRKRPELVFMLARQFPDVQFLMAGKAEDDAQQSLLEKIARDLPNVKMFGYLDKFASDDLQKIYERSWILINTSAREGLPITFIEAAGHGCAILSTVNPDQFASNYGFFAKTPAMLREGLLVLLQDNHWRDAGIAGFSYVKKIYQSDLAIKAHENVYEKCHSGRINHRR